jgi:hypothetical protein
MFEVRLPQMRGLPRILILALLAVLAVVGISFVVVVGVAVVAAGLVISAGAALWYAVRKGLNLEAETPLKQPVDTAASWSSGQVHDVEVEVLPIEELRRH